jgi:transitional endoplasmic reticulum ATPase
MAEEGIGNTLNKFDAVHVAEIVNHGTKLILPEDMSVDQGIDLLKRRKKYLEEIVEFREVFDVFPWDGANALDLTLTKIYGWSPAEATPSFFGPEPPKMLSIEVAYGITRQVPWGRFSLPGIKGHIDCTAQKKNGRYHFAISATVTREHEPAIQKLFKQLREELATNSIYSGKAFKLRFRDDSGEDLPMPEPKFIVTDDISREQLIYSKAVQDQIETNLFTPLERTADCVKNGIPVKRGILLGGPYGTGKSLAAKVASKLAVDNGITFIYVQRADELADAVSFAKLYSVPACAIFCEDIDRAMDGTRDKAMDDILNIIDGIDTKSTNIITVLTTNNLAGIHPAMLRPGRLDAVIEVLPPDAEAVERLIRYYAGASLDESTDLSKVGAILQGKIPAVIAEVVKRAKLAQLRLQDKGTKVVGLSEEALVIAAHSIESQVALINKQETAKVPTIETVIAEIVDRAKVATVEEVRQIMS